jgi:hypothetical protein
MNGMPGGMRSADGLVAVMDTRSVKGGVAAMVAK